MLRASTHTTQARAPADILFQRLLEGTSQYIGREFFRSLVKNLAIALHVRGSWVTEIRPDRKGMIAQAFYLGGDFIEDFEYDLKDTPCETVVAGNSFVLIPDRLVELYPDDDDLAIKESVSYMGAPLLDVDGQTIGLLAALHTKPLTQNPTIENVFKIFASRAAAELQRIRIGRTLQQREAQLSNIVNGAMDAILELDDDLRIVFFNTSAAGMFGIGPDESGLDFSNLLHPENAARFVETCNSLARLPDAHRFIWLPENMLARNGRGRQFHVEGTVSSYESREGTRYCLLLRNVEERIRAGKKIRQLRQETELLKKQVENLSGRTAIIGSSQAMRSALEKVRQVAVTDATVLLHGETGTGKELFAEAIHQNSRRKNKTFVKVNCAAIPAQLMESEFFGHEKGAFTGATAKREGRFVMADGGTIFLDEIGELSYDLQAKLLRVLQEGEFEPVGSSQTHKVNVRIVAATNRNLLEQVGKGLFREDLFYRLNVFPIQIPPLRERNDDIVEIAGSYAAQIAGQTGKRMPPFDARAIDLLKGYHWPGNVRELRNVIERAVICAQGNRWDLRSAMPDAFTHRSADVPDALDGRTPFDTGKLLELEKANILKALQRTGWRVSGPRGAALLLGLNPSTLASKMKSLGIKRP